MSVLAAPNALAWNAEAVGVPAQLQARQQPLHEERENDAVPAPPQSLLSLPTSQQPLQGIADCMSIICDLPQHRANSPEVTETSSSGSSAGTNGLITDTSSENRRSIHHEQTTTTPGTHLRAAKTSAMLPSDAPHIEEVAPESGPVIGGLRIFIIGDNFPENVQLYVRFGSEVTRAVSGLPYI